ncbi:hypothetical protein HPB52_007552 [Rhipicephalus sanguineus]|uniref:Uncharacterized protein n=1 Tax=Rhipicephalus sanguineus TaxID=34632 RepID=A0A9D4T8Y4_RHISA|nr:hypothetical protein HPB52_007552 [Rhipicephalus sanguineus]
MCDELPPADIAFDDLHAAGVSITAGITFEGFADNDEYLELCAELTDDEIIQVTSDDSDTEIEESEVKVADQTCVSGRAPLPYHLGTSKKPAGFGAAASCQTSTSRKLPALQYPRWSTEVHQLLKFHCQWGAIISLQATTGQCHHFHRKRGHSIRFATHMLYSSTSP